MEIRTVFFIDREQIKQNVTYDCSYNKDVSKLYTTVYVTNFSPSLNTRDIWLHCENFGIDIDVFIARKK